jgi:hypothetical protein
MANANERPEEKLLRADVPSLAVHESSLTRITVCSHVEDIVRSVQDEFGSKAELFKHVVVRMDSLNCPDFEATKSPGVYIIIHEDCGCLKVGKSQSNASKRALEHFRDNTSSKDKTVQMAQLRQSDKTHMLVFALQQQHSMHWVLALEHYLENTLKPRIASIRNG